MNNSTSILLFLAKKYPELLKIKDVEKKTPIEYITNNELKAEVEKLIN